MKRSIVHVIFLLVSLSPLLAQPRPLVRLTEADLKDGVLYDAVIAFKDKGPLGAAVEKQIISRLEREFHPEALARRKSKRTAAGLFDERDYPLYEPYLAAVSGTGVQPLVQSRWLNSLTVRGSRAALSAAKGLPCVSGVDCFHEYHPPKKIGAALGETPPAPAEKSGAAGFAAAQLKLIGLDRLHEAGYAGKGVRLAVIDCGFDLGHKAFNRPEKPLKIVDQWDFVDNDASVQPEPGTDPDYFNHGTYVLGVIAADAPGELAGSAPDADFLLYHAEWGDTEYYLEEYWFAAAVERAERMGAAVATTSLTLYGGYVQDQIDGKTPVMTRAVNLALDNGLVCLAGGGNSGHDQNPETSHLGIPGDAPLALSVGAVRLNGEIARFSSDGKMISGSPKPEVLSVGDAPVSVSLAGKTGYTHVSGTSFATPLLAGGVACLLQVHPEWTVKQVREALFKSGDFFKKNGALDPLFVCGYGLPDLFLAAGLKK